MISTVVFDFFDVIRVDPYKKWLADNDYERVGIWYDIAARYDRGMSTREEFLNELSRESGIDPSEVDEAFKRASNFDHDVISIIRNVKQNRKTGLLSNSGGPGLRRLLKEQNLEELFHEIIVSGEVGFIKPEPEIFQIALERLEAEPSSTIFIDDNPHNVDASIELGINGILFTSAKNLVGELEKFGVAGI